MFYRGTFKRRDLTPFAFHFVGSWLENEVKFNVYADYPETYAGGVSTVVFRAESVLIQNSKLYKIENDYTVVYNGSNWIALVGEIEAEYVGWSSNTQIQINNLFKPTMDYIKGFGDGSLQSGCENFLLSCGLAKTEINKIIEIMVV